MRPGPKPKWRLKGRQQAEVARQACDIGIDRQAKSLKVNNVSTEIKMIFHFKIGYFIAIKPFKF